MSDTPKILGQLDAPASQQDLCVAGANVITSMLVACNRGGTQATYNVMAAQAGAALNAKQYLYYGNPIEPNETQILKVFLTLAATDVIRVTPSQTSVSFNLFGIETTDAVRILGQLDAPASQSDLYVAPTAKHASTSMLAVCNRGGSRATFDVMVAAGGASLNAKQYLYYGYPIDPNETLLLKSIITLTAADVVRVTPNQTNLSFNLFGLETT